MMSTPKFQISAVKILFFGFDIINFNKKLCFVNHDFEFHHKKLNKSKDPKLFDPVGRCAHLRPAPSAQNMDSRSLGSSLDFFYDAIIFLAQPQADSR